MTYEIRIDIGKPEFSSLDTAKLFRKNKQVTTKKLCQLVFMNLGKFL